MNLWIIQKNSHQRRRAHGRVPEKKIGEEDLARSEKKGIQLVVEEDQEEELCDRERKRERKECAKCLILCVILIVFCNELYFCNEIY